MRGRISWLLSASLLPGATAATAQPLSCASVSAEVREYVKARGACRDVKPASRPRASKPSPAKASEIQASSPQKSVVPQEPEPGPAAVTPPDSTASLPMPEGSPASTAGAKPVEAPVAAPVTAAAASPAQAPAADLVPASTPTPQAAFPASAALIFGAGASLGLLFGAFSMRQWLLRHQRAVGANVPASSPPQHQQPVDRQPAATAVGSAAQAGGTDEIRFAAWFVPLETKIVLAPRAGEAPIEHSHDHHG